jgi:hypothetical protein
MHSRHPRVASLVLAASIASCAGSTAPYTPAGLSGNAAVRAWSQSVIGAGLPGAGCFRASYPTLVWSRVPCVAAPPFKLPPPARDGERGATIGNNGNQYTIDVAPLAMTGAVGTFDNVKGAKTVTSCPPKDVQGFTCGSHGDGPNVYSLQLNSNFFSTQACGGRLDCAGWEQFVDTNYPGYYATGAGGSLHIQDWLIATGSKALKCPPNQGWIVSKPDCYKNAPYSILVPNIAVTALKGVSLSGSATSSGDSVFLAYDYYVYGMKDAQNGATMYLSQHWTAAQFNIIGDFNGHEAAFSKRTTITIDLQAITGYPSAPRCAYQRSTTEESNNLSYEAPPQFEQPRQYSSILYQETNVSKNQRTYPAACLTLAGQ